jgi:hypothetical protein
VSSEPLSTVPDDPFAGLPLLIPVPRAAKLLGISRAAAYRFAAAVISLSSGSAACTS